MAMKKTAGNKIGLGIFVSVGLALFVIGIYFIGERQQLFRNTFQLSAIFKDVSGLQPGNNVRFSGINVGIVSNIVQINDTSVRVDMQIDERTRRFIKKDARANIGSDGLMGNKLVIVTPGTDGQGEVKSNDYIATVSPINMDDVIAKLKAMGDNASSITNDLAVIMKNIRNGKGTVGMLFTDTVFARNLGVTVVNVKQGAQGLNRDINAASKSFLLRGLLKKKDKENKKDEKKVEEKN
jgi:phospholipid/cholesterol/gamma-HCH transport system substrate-binding protein